MTLPYPILADLCSPVVRIGCGLSGERGADAAALAERCLRALDELEARAAAAGIAAELAQHACYALCAWLDERVLTSDLAARRAWSAEPLQLRRFGELAAGDEFFVRIDALRTDRAPDAVDALEVYALCLALGFRGKHVGPGAEERRLVLLDQLAAAIAGGRANRGDGSPVLPQPAAAARVGWMAPVLALVGLLLTWLACVAWTDAAVATLTAAVAEGRHAP